MFSRFVSGGRQPQFLVNKGTLGEDLALQNIQARCRMLLAYLLAQLLPWVRRRKGFLLVLSSANVDEGLRGYMTKYDCSAADLNPIGSISKLDLKRLLKWGAAKYGYTSLLEVEGAPPTAELRPDDGEKAQVRLAPRLSRHHDIMMGCSTAPLCFPTSSPPPRLLSFVSSSYYFAVD